MTIIAVGDSLVAGYGVAANENWCYLLRSLYGFNIINKGVNGDTTSGVLSRIYGDVLSKGPEYCLLMIGSNDIMINRPMENIVDNITFLLKELKDNKITPIVCIAPEVVPSMAARLWSSEIDYYLVNLKLKELRNELLSYAKENSLTVIDFSSIFSSFSDEEINRYYVDGIHLNKEGNALMASLAQNILKECI